MQTRPLTDTPDVMWAIAQRLETERARFGIAGASYPALNHVPESPWAMVRQSLRIPAFYEKARFGKQIVSAPIEVVLLVVSSEENQRDQARLDPLITPVLDAFDVSVTGGAAIRTLPALVETEDEKLLQLWDEARVERGGLKWGAQYCQAAIVRLDVKFSRIPQGDMR